MCCAPALFLPRYFFSSQLQALFPLRPSRRRVALGSHLTLHPTGPAFHPVLVAITSDLGFSFFPSQILILFSPVHTFAFCSASYTLYTVSSTTVPLIHPLFARSQHTRSALRIALTRHRLVSVQSHARLPSRVSTKVLWTIDLGCLSCQSLLSKEFTSSNPPLLFFFHNCKLTPHPGLCNTGWLADLEL